MSAVLVLGLDPEFVSPERMGGFSPAVVRAYLDAQIDRIRGLGHEVESCLVDFGETAETVLTNQLRSRTFDCVLIGAGVRDEEQSAVVREAAECRPWARARREDLLQLLARGLRRSRPALAMT